MFIRTAVVVDKILERRGSLVVVAEACGIACYNVNYYRIIHREGVESLDNH